MSYTLHGVEKVLSGDKSAVGPTGSQVTWKAIARLMVLCVGSSMPIYRVAKLLCGTAKIFSSSNICRWFKMVAEMLLPLYIYLAEELSEAAFINCDDTKTRCLQMESLAEKQDSVSQQKLVIETEAVLGRQFDKKNGDGKKKSLMLTHLTGHTSIGDEKFRIHFFRTHFGSAGNLLDKLLEMRSPTNRQIYIQSDLSSQNNPSPHLQKLFEINFAGCGAHARRPFWRHRDDDEELCDYLLTAFLLLARVEKRGKDQESLIYQRQKYGTKIWNLIYERALEVVEFRSRNGLLWPKNSKIYAACLYVVSNYKKLTEYLDRPELAYTNNLSERMLRAEKMLLVSCKFRKSEHGRVVFDIFRTIMMTAVANRVNLLRYLTWLLKQDSESIENSPEMYTPWAFRKAPMPSSHPAKAA